MTLLKHRASITVWTFAFGLSLHGAQTPTPAPAPASVKPALTAGQMEAFLLNAKVVRTRPVGTGTTDSLRLTLSDGTVTHDAQAQFVDVSRTVYQAAGYMEFNFRDCFCYNIAAYKLATLLGIDNVPMSVARKVNGKSAAVTWWLDDVAMDEQARRKKSAEDPSAQRYLHYRYRQQVFDELIQNRDRNLGNLLYTTDWTMWMIDHTRAFRLSKDLGKPDELIRIERALFEKLKALTPAVLSAAVGNTLSKAEIEALFARRDLIVKVINARIALHGEGAALYLTPPRMASTSP